MYGAAKIMQSYYETHPDPYLASNAWRWEILAIRMLDMDLVWHFQIGALKGYICSSSWCYGEIYGSDGVVPLSSQQYPGATRQRDIPFSTAAINHIQQKNSSRSRNQFETVLDLDFGIPRKTSDPSQPPPPPDQCTPVPPAIAC